MPLAYLGIDISKLTFDVALLTQDKNPKHRKFSNDQDGFEAECVNGFETLFFDDLDST